MDTSKLQKIDVFLTVFVVVSSSVITAVFRGISTFLAVFRDLGAGAPQCMCGLMCSALKTSRFLSGWGQIFGKTGGFWLVWSSFSGQYLVKKKHVSAASLLFVPS